MNSITVFETQARTLRLDSMDALRAFAKGSPLVTEYAADLLIERGVLMVLPDGMVVGAQLKKTVTTPTHLTWKTVWPKKDTLVAMIAEPIKFKDLRENLIDAGEVGNHWHVVHALKALMNAGLATKEAGGCYHAIAPEVAPTIEVEIEEEPEQDEEKDKEVNERLEISDRISSNLVAVCKQFTPPYPLEKVAVEWVKLMNMNRGPDDREWSLPPTEVISKKIGELQAKGIVP